MLKSKLRELGVFRVEDSLDELYALGHELTRYSGVGGSKPQFAAFPSYIPAETRKPEPGMSLLIDIGGTSTKTGIRRVNNDHREIWQTLFETKNLEFRSHESGDGNFEDYTSLLCDALVSALDVAGLSPKQISSVGVVWSNAILSEQISERVVSGRIAQKRFYNKGEWFLEGLNEGDDIGLMLRSALEERGIKAEKFLVANDTPLTCKATRFASSGVVASTGVNGTLIKSLHELGLGEADDRIICNAEMGSNLEMKPDWLADADLLDGDRQADQIERMIGGGFLRKLLCAYIIALRDHGVEELQALAAALEEMGEARWKEFRGTDVGLLVGEQRDLDRFAERRSFSLQMSPALAATLREITEVLVVRAAKLASVVAYSSIANQFERGERLVVSLDSRLAREMTLFWSVMRDEFYSRIPKPAAAELVLVEPIYTAEGSISVPLRGAAAALDSLG